MKKKKKKKMAGKVPRTFSLYKQSKNIYVTGKFKLLFGCFLDAINIFKAKMTKLEQIMCHPLPDSYTEWYLICFTTFSSPNDTLCKSTWWCKQTTDVSSWFCRRIVSVVSLESISRYLRFLGTCLPSAWYWSKVQAWTASSFVY